MRKLLFTLPAIVICTLFACNDSTKVASANKEDSMNETVERNKKADQMIGKAFENGDVSVVDSFVADNFVDHTADKGDVAGKDSLKAMIKFSREHFKDMKSETIRQVADDEYVFSLMRFTGTCDGKVPGMPAGPMDMRSLEVSRYKDGKAVEHWTYMEPREMMKMMGSSGPMMDTTKKK